MFFALLILYYNVYTDKVKCIFKINRMHINAQNGPQKAFVFIQGMLPLRADCHVTAYNENYCHQI